MKKMVYIFGVILLELATVAQSAKVIVNEYNAVGSEKYLDSDTYEGSTKSDARLGRVKGNGGDWIELVVTEDHADLRNYQIRWWEMDGSIESNPAAIWATSIDKIGMNQGIITFKNVNFWSDLRKGTMITLTEDQTILAEDQSVVVSGNKTKTNLVPGGDWWINIWTADPDELYVHTETLKYGDVCGNFSVGNDDWEVNIYDGTAIVFGPIGEAISGWTAGGINSREVGKLEADPSYSSDISEFADGTSSTFGLPNCWHDNNTGEEFTQNFDALRNWSWQPGDANLDNVVDVGDLGILAANYGSSNADWRKGDFNGDGVVDVGDLGILAANYGAGKSGTSDFNADYARILGTQANKVKNESLIDGEDDLSEGSICSGLGLSLITAVFCAGLLMVKINY